MSIKRLTNFFTAFYANPWGHILVLSIYYLAIIAGLVWMYGKGDFSTPDFVYQGF